MAQAGVGQDRSKPATMYEVAALAGVSHQTVSRYLKDKGGLKPATLERVEKAMAELKYSPNLAARSLRTRKQYRVVVLVPEASLYFPLRMLNGAAKAAHAAGYRVDVVSLEGTAKERSQKISDLLAGEDLAGLLSFAPLPGNSGSLQSSVPVVVAGEYDDKMRGRGSLADGTFEAKIVEHLAGLGHRHFFHVAGPEAWLSARNRRDAYEDAIQRLGLTSHGIGLGDWSAASGYTAAQEIVKIAGVTAVVAANDQMAFGVLRALHEKGIAVPGQISVFGWDDLAESRFFVPSLSTVSMDLEALGERSMAELIAAVQGVPPPDNLPSTPTMRLVIRESIGPARTN
ncbi:LacI family DNA-binding transcriptional regulator [Arthrobacter sp. ISL-30]|uniref:LacI family DNA-binding transcriptional regulator n=1 Tax=Arthrobacter sp. ISL-30 TaxID=2819109 RepID=UPI001BEA2158|nr:LacI family DNA-binding transcriptional regulator [Arthrobacter sp. ISL-30]MBT2512336.1 LacI family DNA-binding transcriptional regulator [Arthrobacter sp. ISL-30]